jgi:hypothetical protein
MRPSEGLWYYADVTRGGQNNRNPSSVFNSIFFASGDNGSSDFGDYCAEFIMFEICVLSASGGLPYVPVV